MQHGRPTCAAVVDGAPAVAVAPVLAHILCPALIMAASILTHDHQTSCTHMCPLLCYSSFLGCSLADTVGQECRMDMHTHHGSPARRLSALCSEVAGWPSAWRTGAWMGRWAAH